MLQDALEGQHVERRTTQVRLNRARVSDDIEVPIYHFDAPLSCALHLDKGLVQSLKNRT